MLFRSNVLNIHTIAEDYKKQGYYIFLTGTEGHPEVIGTKSHCGENFSLISLEKDIEKAIKNFEKTNINKLLLISQTTYSTKKFDEVRKKLEEKISKNVNLVIKNTICLATEQNQKEAKEISSKVDMSIVIGGKNSSNTRKLYEIAKEECKNTILIESKIELEETKFDNIEKIGIMAGASTSHESINEIIDFLNVK